MKSIRYISIILIFAVLISFSSCTGNNSILPEDSSYEGTVVDQGTIGADEPRQTYISDLKICAAYWDNLACSAEGKLKSRYGREYELCEDANLNRDCGTTTDCIYLYQSKTTNRDEAITHIIAINNRNYQNSFTASDGCYYEVVGGIRINSIGTSTSEYDRIDLNMNAGGAYIYIYVTHDNKYTALTDVTVGSESFIAEKDRYFYVNNYFDGEKQEFNEAAGGADIYIAYTNKVTGWEVSYITLIDFDLNGERVTKEIKMETAEKLITEEMLVPFIDKGESTHFVGYFDMRNLQNIKVEPGMSYENDKDLWARWEYDIKVDATEYGGEIYDYTGDKFPGKVMDRYVYCWYDAETGETVQSLVKPGTYRPNLF